MTARTMSGKFVLRLEPELHRRLRELATSRGASLNALCASILERASRADHSEGSGQGDTLANHTLARVEIWSRQTQIETLGVVLFGSAARGQMRATSDIDLLVVIPEDVAIRRELYREWDASAQAMELTHEISPHFVHLPKAVEEAGSLWLEAAVEGQILVGVGRRLQDFMVELRASVAKGRFSRHSNHGHHYWRRNG